MIRMRKSIITKKNMLGGFVRLVVLRLDLVLGERTSWAEGNQQRARGIASNSVHKPGATFVAELGGGGGSPPPSG